MNQTLADPTKKLCPSMSGGSNYWPPSYSQKTKLLYIPAMSSCNEVTLDPTLSNKAGDWKGAKFRNIERNETDLILADPFTGEVKKNDPHPLPQQQRRAEHRRRPGVHRLHRRHFRGLRRHHAGARCGRSTSAPASTRRR